MGTELVHLGFSNMAAMNKVMAVISPNSAPAKRIVHECKGNGHLIDVTNGRKTKAILVMESGHIILAAISPETIAGRVVSARRAELGECCDEECCEE
ncbi:MAG: DUF370 domain-containing protein [Chloroflexi bacterium]|nr:DUF370 domain-containing protein [Chloroflexota bacterium]